MHIRIVKSNLRNASYVLGGAFDWSRLLESKPDNRNSD